MSEDHCGTQQPGNGLVICTNPPGHIEDHYDPMLKVSWPREPARCGVLNHGGALNCEREPDHPGAHAATDERGVTFPWFGDPSRMPATLPDLDSRIPDSVRTRVELHRAQTAYDLTVLRAQLDTTPANTQVSRRLRTRREQLTAELDAWAYLASITRNPR